MTDVLVLGWDALDLELVEEYGLGKQFGQERRKIETFANPVIGEPHTRELWPSMITGRTPSEHGVHAATEGGGVDWEPTWLSVASAVASGVIPHRARAYVGRRLREYGAGLDSYTNKHYEENDVSTVFDGLQSRAISIPNYETKFDRAHELDAHRNQLWQAINIDKSPDTGIRPQVDLDHVDAVLGYAVGTRAGLTMTALNQHDLVWTWFGLLDTIGHINPAIDADLQTRYYERAASITQMLREQTSDDCEVVVVSDHGLQDGEHTHYATLCGSAEAVNAIDSVLDVREWIEQCVDENANKRVSVNGDELNKVQSQLEELGYI